MPMIVKTDHEKYFTLKHSLNPQTNNFLPNYRHCHTTKSQVKLRIFVRILFFSSFSPSFLSITDTIRSFDVINEHCNVIIPRIGARLFLQLFVHTAILAFHPPNKTRYVITALVGCTSPVLLISLIKQDSSDSQGIFRTSKYLRPYEIQD